MHVLTLSPVLVSSRYLSPLASKIDVLFASQRQPRRIGHLQRERVRQLLQDQCGMRSELRGVDIRFGSLIDTDPFLLAGQLLRQPIRMSIGWIQR